MLFAQEPLAYRMRPRTIDEVIGQDDVIGSHTALYRMIKNGYVPSLLLYDRLVSGKRRLLMRSLERYNVRFIRSMRRRQEKRNGRNSDGCSL